jgi:exopolyphosphatase/pppGpp-phosphohydrolase
MRLALIDCGTNTFHLLVADVRPENLERMLALSVPVRLGKRCRLSPDGCRR